MDRLEQLLAYHSENPSDSFLRYAIALEYIKKDLPETAKLYFEELIKVDPDYVGTYYHLARLYRHLGLTADAENCYRNGIEVATKLNEQHALAELKNAYMNFQLGLDEE